MDDEKKVLTSLKRGLLDEPYETLFANMGADDYVTKPFDKDKLLARVKMLLRPSS